MSVAYLKYFSLHTIARLPFDNLPLSDLFLWTQRVFGLGIVRDYVQTMSKLPNTQIMIFIWWKSEHSLSR